MGFSIGKVFAPIESEMRKYCEVDSLYMPSLGYGFCAMWQNIRAVKKQLRTQKYDIVHITGSEHYLIPFINRSKVIVTVHDIMYYSYLSGIKQWLWKQMFINVLRKADWVTYISQYTQEQVNRVVKLSRYIVVLNPVSSKFKFKPQEFNSQMPIILHIGTLSRKNLHRTIEALHGINCHLRIVGKLQKETIDLLESREINYSNVYSLTDQQILEEYENCDIVNFPSTFEGFGMPIIEGQSIGRIVLTSNIPPMNAVCGDAAYLVNPYEVEDIKYGYEKIISNSQLRDDLILKGLNNVSKYQLEKITLEYKFIYDSIVK